MADKIHISIREENIRLEIGGLQGGGGGVGGGGVALQGSGTYVQHTGTIQFSNSPTIRFGLASNGVMTASASHLPQTGISAIMMGDTTFVSGTVSLVNSNGISFGSAGINMISASYQSNLYQQISNTSNITSLAFPYEHTTLFPGLGTTTNSIAGEELKMTLNSEGLNLGVPNWITAGGGVQSLDTQFVGLLTTGITGGSMTANSSQLRLSIPDNAGSMHFVDGSGITFNISNDGTNQTTIGASVAAGGNGGGGAADWSISSVTGVNILISTGAATNTLYQPAYITTYQTSGGGGAQSLDTQFVGLLTTGMTGGSMTANSSQLRISIPNNAGSMYFNDTNGISWSVISETNMQTTIVASYAPADTGVSASNTVAVGATTLRFRNGLFVGIV